MTVTWLGNASILVNVSGEQILFDPFLEWKGGEHPTFVSDFSGIRNIMITHAHVDHLSSMPKILADSGDPVNVYGTRQTKDNLARAMEKQEKKAKREIPYRFFELAPGGECSVGDAKITVFQGRHVRFDRKLILKTAFSPRIFRRFSNLLYAARIVPKYPEKGETVVYRIEGEGKSVLIMGSLGLEEHTEYPTGADLFVCPFQGHSRIGAIAEEIALRLQPKHILLDHFDNAFPPLTTNIDTAPFVETMQSKHGIEVLIPRFKHPVEI